MVKENPIQRKGTPAWLRALVFARDRGICAKCRIDCVLLRERISRLMRAGYDLGSLQLVLSTQCGENGNEATPRSILTSRSFWEVNHIIPISEGGAQRSLKNVETLCWWCHRETTKGQARQRAFGDWKSRYLRQSQAIIRGD